MTDQIAHTVWSKIIEALEERLQYAFLDRAREVVDVRLNDKELSLFVTTDEAAKFFNQESNQQRISIIGRSIHPIESFKIVKIEAVRID